MVSKGLRSDLDWIEKVIMSHTLASGNRESKKLNRLDRPISATPHALCVASPSMRKLESDSVPLMPEASEPTP